jgi:DNA-binding MarR family transcriptional regulator
MEARDIAARLRLSSTRLARRLRQEADSGYTPSQLSVLSTVRRHGPLTLGTLAGHERVAPPSITKVVAKLEAEGLVARTPDPTDGRVAHIAITSAGQALMDQTRRRKTSWLAGRIAELPAEDQARLGAALDALDHLVDAPDGGTS